MSIRDPDRAVSCETMPGPSKHRSGCSQSAIGWITGSPMEELEKVPKIGGYWLVHIVVPPIGLRIPLAPWVLSLAPPLEAP